jgi:hypothetical protein
MLDKQDTGQGDLHGDDGRTDTDTLRCLCLGLGRPTTSDESRGQLCVLLDLCAELGIVRCF